MELELACACCRAVLNALSSSVIGRLMDAKQGVLRAGSGGSGCGNKDGVEIADESGEQTAAAEAAEGYQE